MGGVSVLMVVGILGAVMIIWGVFRLCLPFHHPEPIRLGSGDLPLFTAKDRHFFTSLALMSIGFLPVVFQVKGDVIIPKLQVLLKEGGPFLASLGSLLP